MQPKPQIPPGYMYVQPQAQIQQAPAEQSLPSKTALIHDLLGRLGVVESLVHSQGRVPELVKLLEVRLNAINALQ